MRKIKVSGFGFRVSSLKFKVSGLKYKVCLRRICMFGSGLKFHSSFFILHSSLLILFLVSLGCRRYNTQQPESETESLERKQKEILMRVNRDLVEEEAKAIDAFAAQKGWQIQTSESGLRYMICQNGQGEKAATGKVAELAFTVSLLDGTVCYSSAQSGPKTFRLGKGGVEPGLEEGVLLMRVGDKARFIMPPHLAHGLLGDGDRIPRRAVILYDVELLGLK